MPNRQVIAGLGTLAGILAMSLIRRRSKYDLRGKTVLVTGGSRGLGLLLAREFAARGARVAISARDPEELGRAADQLRRISSEILPLEVNDRVAVLRVSNGRWARMWLNWGELGQVSLKP